MIRKLGHWVRDYLYAGHRIVHSFIFRKPPRHYLGYVQAGKVPVIVIPGIYEKWNFLKPLADAVSLKGHPVYILPRLKSNTHDIVTSAGIVRELIDDMGLHNIILLAHSKGGLIGKHLLAFLNQDQRVKHLITIATPFSGSHIARLPLKGLHELRPGSDAIRALHARGDVNHHITSLYGLFDNHVWPGESCRLEGAENICIEAHGHHAILASHRTRDAVLRTIEKISA